MGEYAVAKTSVWWDIENCAVPRSCDPQLLVQNMSSALAAAGYSGPISISAYGDTNGIAHHVQQALSSTGISLNHVPAGIKDASDKKILVDMLIWAIDNPPPANYLLISGDRDFSNALYKLKMRRYNILLAQPPNVSQTLTTVAKSVWLWKSLVDGEPPLSQSPYVSSTPRGNKDGLNKLKNIVSGPSDTTPPSSPQMQNSYPCDHEESGNGKATGASNGLPASGGVKKKSRRCLPKSSLIRQGIMCYMCGADHKASVCVRPVPGQGVMCFKCGADHKAYECSWNGPCKHCGVRGHMGRVCPQNPASIIKWCYSVSTSAPAASSHKSVKASKAAAAAQPTSLLRPAPGQCAPTVPSAPPQLPGLQAPTTISSSAPAASPHGSVQASKAVAAEQPTSCASVASPPGSFQALKAVATAQPSLGLGSPQVLCRPTVPAQAPQMFYTMPTTIFSSAPAASSHGSVKAWKAAAQSSAFWGTFFQGFYRLAIPPQLPTSSGFCTFRTATSASRPNGKDVQ